MTNLIGPEFPEEAQFLNDPMWSTRLFPCFGVSDEEGRLAKEYTPTRNELAVLARYYQREIYDYEELSFIHGEASSHGVRFEPFALGRLDRIERILGPKRMDQVLGNMRARRDKFIQDGLDLAHRRGVATLAALPPDDPELRDFMSSHPV